MISETLLLVPTQMFPEPSMAMLLVAEGRGWPDAPRSAAPVLSKPSRYQVCVMVPPSKMEVSSHRLFWPSIARAEGWAEVPVL